MMPVLRFSGPASVVNGRLVKAATFERRSRLPISAACVVANTVREILAAILARPVNVALCEPVIPSAQAWSVLIDGATIFRARGHLSDGAFIVRPADAVALTSGIFREECAIEARALSAIEADVLQRAIASLGKALGSVCGLSEDCAVTRCTELSGYCTYFELLFDAPFQAALGVALSRDPVERISRKLDCAHLLDVEVHVAAQFASGSITAETLLGMKPGTLLRMDTKLSGGAVLTVADGTVYHGECGALDRRNVFLVQKTAA
ncbi:MAG: FliM/FliN family flagellar motor switch protein [Candidatus Eremiobacteraeota bacterium]|nr:FliM/FliN family flagellar motor switch protein [Candidatus Eremiobacteraeota bacterium]